MDTTTSADGSVIAYETVGSGDVLICIPPAFRLRDVFADLAAELADDYTVVCYDRRGRGDSTDAIPPADVGTYRIEREVEDLAAVTDAVGGRAGLLGYSSGGFLALHAAAAGGPYTRIALYEASFRRDAPSSTALVAKLTELIRTGRPGDAVATFQIEGIGLPVELVEQMRNSPMFAGLEAIAQTVVYDATLTADPQPTEAMRRVSQPVLSMAGSETWPLLIDGAKYAAEQIPTAEFVEVPGGANHDLDAVEVAKVLRVWR